MNYRKIDTPENYRFAPVAADPGAAALPGGNARVLLEGGPHEQVELELEDCGSDVYRLEGRSARWPRGTGSLAGLDASSFAPRPSEAACRLSADGGVSLSLDGATLLSGAGFGLSGPKWMLRFKPDEALRFHALGGKNLGYELSGKRTLFWNTDLFADFEWSAVAESRADPLYASFPVLIGRKAGSASGGPWFALVMDAPYPGFANLGAGEGIFAAGSTPFERWLYLGARDGAPDVWILADRSGAGLVRKIQALQGRAELPPLWALGHQQCRWGYKDYADLDRVATEYEKRGIPNDGLWLDIDYMDGFRVFTIDRRHFDAPVAQLADLTERGFRIVPILDPGLRRDREFPAYASAKERDLLCRNPEGGDYIGFVWPGYTAFPDFSLPEARAWWASEVERFAKLGFSGFWIDMNDPSTGSAPLFDMRFGRGEIPHEAFHNQYALGMAMATREGLERARPDLRQFLISRSAYLGMAKHAGMWTGDNVSNVHHLRTSVAFSLNLSVSGMPFNGPDLPGFAGDASAALMEAWYKAGFLFPFLRNHSVAGSRDQEPWTRGRRTERVVAEYIRSRYKLLPYLYQAWIEAAENGDPVMRPLWYQYPEEAWTSGAEAGDEFLAGPDLLHAPVLDERAASRIARLPAGRWFDWAAGRFMEGGRVVRAAPGREGTPLFVRSGAVVPMLPGTRDTNHKDLRLVDFVLFVEEGGTAAFRYRADDGETLAYRAGARSVLDLQVRVEGWIAFVETALRESGYGNIVYRIIVPVSSGIRAIELNGERMELSRERLALAGRRHRALATETRTA